MNKNRKLKGKEGEDIVVDFLRSKDYKILERNYRFGRKEIDIIAKKGELVVFVEVKYRSGNQYGSGLEAINEGKKKNIRLASLQYLSRHGFIDKGVRFDVASVDNGKLTYIENAF